MEKRHKIPRTFKVGYPYRIEQVGDKIFVCGHEGIWEWTGEQWVEVLSTNERDVEYFRKFPGFPLMAKEINRVFYYNENEQKWKILVDPYKYVWHVQYNPKENVVIINTDEAPLGLLPWQTKRGEEEFYLVTPDLKIEKIDKETWRSLAVNSFWYFDGEIGWKRKKIYKNGKEVFEFPQNERITAIKKTPIGYVATGFNFEKEPFPVLYVSPDGEQWKSVDLTFARYSHQFHDALCFGDELIIIANNNLYFVPINELSKLVTQKQNIQEQNLTQSNSLQLDLFR